MAFKFQGRYGPLLIAEIGGNHEGCFATASNLCQLALETGADCVKFQVYQGDSLVSRLESPDRNAHFKRFELSIDQHIQLAELCRNHGALYTASVWSLDLLDKMDPYLPFYKVGSGDLTAQPILAELAARGKPIVLSTGLATFDEVLEAIDFLQTRNSLYKSSEYLALLQCTSMYPIQECDARLSLLQKFARETKLAVGYSDHTEGGLGLRVAAALGAEILEFHFTDSRDGKVFRDHKVSLTPQEVRSLARDMRRIRDLIGEPVKEPLPCELETDHVRSFRRSVYPARDLEAGTVLDSDDLVCLRPNHGIDARDFNKVVGMQLTRSLQAHQKLEWDHLSPVTSEQSTPARAE